MHSFVDPRLTERRNPRSAQIDNADALELVDLMNAEDSEVAARVAACRVQIARVVEMAENALRSGGRLIYVGAGTSGRLGVLDASECPPTFGTDPAMVVGIIAGGRDALVRSAEGAEDDMAAAEEAMEDNRVSGSDLVVGIAASGTTPYVQAALAEARRRGSATAAVVCAEPPEELAAVAEVIIFVRVGPEVVTGSTRLKAGTATKLVLNTISTGAMVLLGKTYGNLMVDLRTWSAKLEDRGERIVMEVCRVDRQRAREAIARAGGAVKLALVMLSKGVGQEEAERLLESSEGRLRPLLGDPPESITG